MVSPELSEAEVLDRFAGIVAESLRVPRERVTPAATLTELGAESLDVLEITMQAEDEFGILLPQQNILETAQQVIGPGALVADGRLTAQAVALLRQRMPELEAGSIAAGMPVAELTPIFQRVGAWVRLIHGLAKQTPRVCPKCGGPLPKPVVGRATCAGCGTPIEVPSGDDLNRTWVETYAAAINQRPS